MRSTPFFEAIHVSPQKKQTNANAKMAFALVPFLWIVNGLNTDNCLNESPVCSKVLYRSKRLTSMFKMPQSRDHHGQSMLLAVFNRIFIAYRTTRLNKCSNACFMSKLYTIIKWKKRITGHHGALQIKFKLSGFFYQIGRAS